MWHRTPRWRSCSAIGWAAACFEIVQCHYPRWDLTPADAVADAGLHALLAIGRRVQMGPTDPTALAAVEVDLWHENQLAVLYVVQRDVLRRYPDKGRCPGGGSHDAAGFNFVLDHK